MTDDTDLLNRIVALEGLVRDRLGEPEAAADTWISRRQLKRQRRISDSTSFRLARELVLVGAAEKRGGVWFYDPAAVERRFGRGSGRGA